MGSHPLFGRAPTKGAVDALLSAAATPTWALDPERPHLHETTPLACRPRLACAVAGNLLRACVRSSAASQPPHRGPPRRLHQPSWRRSPHLVGGARPAPRHVRLSATRL